MNDPIRELYRLFSLARTASLPNDLREQMQALDTRVKSMHAATASDWLTYYREVERAARAAIASGQGQGQGQGQGHMKDGAAAPQALTPAARRRIDGYLRQLHEALRAGRDLWLGRLDRQRDNLLDAVRGQCDQLRIDEATVGGGLEVRVTDAEASAWAAWLDSSAASWVEQVRAGPHADTSDKLAHTLAPAQESVPSGVLAPPDLPALSEISVAKAPQTPRAERQQLAGAASMFLRSLRSSLFAVLMVAGLGLSVAGTLVGISGGNAKAYLVLVLLPFLAFFAWRTARRDARRDREDKRRSAVAALLRAYREEAESYVRTLHIQLRSRIERFFTESSQLVSHWLTETEYRLEELSAKAPASPRAPAWCDELERTVLPAIARRITELAPPRAGG